MKPELYKDHLIITVFQFTSGKTDYEIFPELGAEQGWIAPNTTLENVKIDIDERIAND